MKLLFLVIPDSDRESIPWGDGTSPVGASLVGALGRDLTESHKGVKVTKPK